MTDDELIAAAAAVLNPVQRPDGRLFGDVGAALVSTDGAIFTGVCVDTFSWGLCAERSAIAAMVTAGAYRVERIVAVWRDPATGRLHVLPPCGHCRQFMREVDEANLDTRVILGRRESLALRDLLPRHEWPAPLD